MIKTITGLALMLNAMNVNTTTPNLNTNFIGYDFSSGQETFTLPKMIYETPNTIQCWIKLGTSSPYEEKGTIFGNYCQYNTGSINLEINKNSNLVLNWNSNEARVIFDQFKLEANTWYFITITRDTLKNTFNLYINGELRQTINEYVGSDPKSFYNFRIGADYRNWHDYKIPFKGEIGQVTLYSEPLNSVQIYNDYLYSDTISDSTRENLLFNTYLSYKNDEPIDTSKYKNNPVKETLDYFYDGELFETKDYSFVVVPDPQMITHHHKNYMHYLGDYVLSNKDEHNITSLLCVGDNADASGDWDGEYSNISNEFSRLDGEVRYMTTPGNHDYDDNCTKSRNLSWFNKYFTEERFEKLGYFGGTFKENELQNAYYLFEESSIKYLVISIEFGADDQVLNWANEIAASYPDRRIIVITHGYLDADGQYLDVPRAHAPKGYSWNNVIEVNDGSDIYNKFIKKHKNMFMVLCGHVPTDDIIFKESIGDNGNIIMNFLIDGQGLLNNAAGENMLALFSFDEVNQELSINYVSTITKKLFNTQNQFKVSFKGNTDLVLNTNSVSTYKEKESYKLPTIIDLTSVLVISFILFTSLKRRIS